MNDRIVNNTYSARSKANVKSPAPQVVATKGQLVFLRNEMSKHSPREVYLVTNVDAESNFLIIQKLLHVLSNTSAKVTSNKFKVKQTDIIVAPNQSFYIDTPDSVIDANHFDEAPDEAIHADDKDPEEDIWSPVVSYNTVNPHTTAPSPPALRPNPNPLPPAVPQPMLPQPLDPTQTTQPARIISPISNDVLTGQGLFQHFPTSPILTQAPCPSPHSLLSQSSTTHLSVSTHSCDLAWDNYASSPSFNNPLRPRGKAIPSPSASQDSSEPALPSSDDNIFVDKDDPDWQPHPQLKAPKKKSKPKVQTSGRSRLQAQAQPGRPLHRSSPHVRERWVLPAQDNVPPDEAPELPPRAPVLPLLLPPRYPARQRSQPRASVIITPTP